MRGPSPRAFHLVRIGLSAVTRTRTAQRRHFGVCAALTIKLSQPIIALIAAPQFFGGQIRAARTGSRPIRCLHERVVSDWSRRRALSRFLAVQPSPLRIGAKANGHVHLNMPADRVNPNKLVPTFNADVWGTVITAHAGRAAEAALNETSPHAIVFRHIQTLERGDSLDRDGEDEGETEAAPTVGPPPTRSPGVKDVKPFPVRCTDEVLHGASFRLGFNVVDLIPAEAPGAFRCDLATSTVTAC